MEYTECLNWALYLLFLIILYTNALPSGFTNAKITIIPNYITVNYSLTKRSDICLSKTTDKYTIEDSFQRLKLLVNISKIRCTVIP